MCQELCQQASIWSKHDAMTLQISQIFFKFMQVHINVIINTLRAAWFRRFSQKNSSFWLPYQCPSSSAHCARELFSGSNGSASLVDCTRKKFFTWGVRFFFEWRHKWRTFWPPWPTLPGPRRQPLGGSILLKFLLETRLQSESFDTLDNLLGFLVQKLWC